ncbi:MAG: caspase family protein [Elusimicrobia bacterium]|nr:caspase family protein [Elusimicrobiota bacterium]
MIAVWLVLAALSLPAPLGSQESAISCDLQHVLMAGRGIRGLAFGPAGGLVSIGDDKTISVWDLDKGTRLAALQGHRSRVRAAAIAPDGRTLATGADDRTVMLWEVASGRAVQSITGLSKSVGAVAFSPDGATVASGDDGGTIELWNVKFGKSQGRLTGHEGKILALTFTPDGQGLISASGDKTVRLWDVAGRKERRTLSESASRYGEVVSVAFSAGSDIFAMGLTEVKSREGSRRARAGAPVWSHLVKLRSASTGEELAVFSGHMQEVVSVALDDGGRLAASGGPDKTVHLWDVGRKAEITALPQDSAVVSVALSRDGQWLAAAGNDGKISAWRIRGLPPPAAVASAARQRADAPRAEERPAPPAPSPVLAAYKAAPREDDFALVIGIEGYSTIPKADFAERDAGAVLSHIEALGVPRRNIIHLAGAQAGFASFKKYLESWLPRNVKPSSRVFFYYSGHGAPDPKTGEAFLVPWDGDPGFLSDTAYPVKRLYNALAALQAGEVVILLDACFSGAGGRSVLAQGARPLVTRVDIEKRHGGKLSLLTAASADEITTTYKEASHGIFTYFLLKGLNGEAKDASGRITTKSLFEYLQPRVQDEARRQNREQTPTFDSDLTVTLR